MTNYGEVKAALQSLGKLILENDQLIAALALQHNLTLMSSDTHFAFILGLIIVTIFVTHWNLIMWGLSLMQRTHDFSPHNAGRTQIQRTAVGATRRPLLCSVRWRGFPERKF